MREDWLECEAELLGDLIRGINYKKTQSSDSKQKGYLPILRANNIRGNSLNFDDLKYVEQDLVKSEQRILRGDIVFAMSSGSKHLVGKSGQAKSDYKGSFGAFCSVFRPNKNIDQNFIQFYFHSGAFRRIISNASKGSNINNLKREHVLNAIIPIPSLSEQRAIVSKIEELFSDLDKGVADLKKAQEQLKVYRQAVLKKAFEGELTKDWREQQNDLPLAEELLDQIKEERLKHYELQIENWKQAVDEWEEHGKKGKKPTKPQKHKVVEELTNVELKELTALPVGWKWIKNNELMYYVTSGSRDWKKFYSDTEGTYFVRTQDIKTNRLDLSSAAFVDLPKHVEGKRSLIEKGDLLMTITGANVGKIAHVDFDISEAYVSQSVALMKYVLKSFGPFLHYYFQSSATGAKFIGAMVYGVGRPVLSLDNMRDAPVSVCSFEEQHQIVQEIESRLSVCDKVEESITESLEKAKALRQSILKKAFEGDLLSEKELLNCKNEVDYEPATELLKRIKYEKR